MFQAVCGSIYVCSEIKKNKSGMCSSSVFEGKYFIARTFSKQHSSILFAWIYNSLYFLRQDFEYKLRYESSKNPNGLRGELLWASDVTSLDWMVWRSIRLIFNWPFRLGKRIKINASLRRECLQTGDINRLFLHFNRGKNY